MSSTPSASRAAFDTASRVDVVDVAFLTVVGALVGTTSAGVASASHRGTLQRSARRTTSSAPIAGPRHSTQATSAPRVFCDKAEMLCKMKSLEYKKYMLDVDYSREDFVEKFPEARTFPQITMDGNYIGGFTELDAHLA